MSSLVITPCLADAKTAAVRCYRSNRPLQQLKGSWEDGFCLGSIRHAPQHLTICGIPLESSLVAPLHLRRRPLRGSKLTWRSLQPGPRADSEREERPSRPEVNGRGGLDELDNQLRSLSSSDNAMSAAKEARKEPGKEVKLSREGDKKVDWPVFTEGFPLFLGVGLIVLTIVNNLLFNFFIGPPTKKPPSQATTEAPQVPQRPYKLRSYNDPQYRQNAPPFTDKALVNTD